MLRSPLLGTLRELERLYREAEQALVATPSQGLAAAESGSSAAARAALFDDDLDLRGPDKSRSGRWVMSYVNACESLEFESAIAFAHLDRW